MEPHPDPRAELDALTNALAGEVRRRSARGLRRAEVGTPAAGPGEGQPLQNAGPAEGAVGPVPEPASPAAGPATQAPAAATPPPAPRAAPAPAPPGAQAPANAPAPAQAPSSNLEQRVAEVRARAAACSDLGSLQAAVAACTACGLCRTRKQTVFAQGSGARRIMFIGEAPGEQEDLQGLPFVGPAGQLLTDIIQKGMGIDRREVAVANVLKCRPPGNRDPLPEEKALCTPWLDRQIELFDPLVIVPLGKHASNHVLDPQGRSQGREASMGSMRGRMHERGGRRVVPTYHPSYLLRSPEMKPRCWEDIQRAMKLLELPPPVGRQSEGRSSDGGR